jgi:hypothetical protein
VSAIHVDLSIDQAQAISRHTHNPLYEVLAGMNRIVKDHNIAAMHRAVRKDAVQKSVAAVTQLVHQQVVPDQQRVFHGLGRNLESLDDKGNDKDRDHYGSQQLLQRNQPVRVRRFSHHDSG